MGTAVQIEIALDQAPQFEKEVQWLFMQTGKIEVWNKIKARSAAVDVDGAHAGRRENEAAARHKKELEDLVETVLLIVVLTMIVVGAVWGTYEFIKYCKLVGCGS